MKYEYNHAHVNKQIEQLENLANKLHSKVFNSSEIVPPKVLCFVGAGPSKEANLPLAPGLKNLIRNKFVSNEPAGAKIHDLLEDEIHSDANGTTSYEKLTFFEFAAIVSRFSYGRKIIDQTIIEHLKNPTHRPLTYELLAHLAKHRYIDHFMILNFDRLLDDSLLDELPERVKIIASPQDIPLSETLTKHECFAVHPFGILGEGSYSLTPDDVNRFGPVPICKFIENKLLQPDSFKILQPIVLILIGYRAEEPAFSRFLTVQKEMWSRNNGTERPLEIFVIDPDPDAKQKISVFSSTGSVTVNNIVLYSDDAMELLFDLLRLKWQKSDKTIWTSASRHRIISKLFTYQQLRPENERFKIELLLQGLKSRGFIHLEAFSNIPRLNKYGSEKSYAIITELLDNEVIERDEWQMQTNQLKDYVPNYMIEDEQKVIDEFIRLAKVRKVISIDEWRIQIEKGDESGETKDQITAILNRIDLEEFLKREIAKIKKSPEIEIVRDASPEVSWSLGYEAKPLTTIDSLTRDTASLLKKSLEIENDNIIKIFGIWSTGEWLFHEDGWAYSIGKEILKRSDVELKILITRSGGVRGERTKRREYVKNTLVNNKHNAKIELRLLNWWELNRILTIVYDKEGNKEAIYMRRRLCLPLVCPYHIGKNASNAHNYLSELWDVYWSRGEVVLTNPVQEDSVQ